MKSEMDKLQNWLKKNHIQHERRSIIQNGDQILIENDNIKISCICHYGSYGYNQGLIEMWDFANEPEGWLTAEACKRRIKKRVAFNKKVCRV